MNTPEGFKTHQTISDDGTVTKLLVVDLTQLDKQALVDELARREREEGPQLVESPALGNLQEYIIGYLDLVRQDVSDDELSVNSESCFEVLIETLLEMPDGSSVWDWINKRR